ncbi:MAG: SpoIIE family protein phosphatase [Planctomycetaceae bacterium]|nr:SpoIIE family protein phosphatase [Planctomycetaceae bacterium]
MAVLEIVEGGIAGTQYGVRREQTLIGRHPNCHVVLQNGVVSRHHAQILESHGQYSLEDLRSRNGCYLNGEKIDGRVPLKDGDEIRLCDVVLRFLEHPSKEELPRPVAGSARETIDLDDLAATSGSAVLDESHIFVVTDELDAADGLSDSFESPTSSRSLVGDLDEDTNSRINPNVKLQAVLEITRALSRELRIEKVLPKLLETLFNIFPQAEQGFVLLREGDEENSRLKLKASRARGGQTADAVAISMTVVRHALQTKEAILSENVLDDSRFKGSTALSKMRIRSMMCVPLLTQDAEQDGLGVIQIVTRDENQAFTDEDLDLLITLASQAAIKVENARLHEEALQNREFERDLEFATQVQLGFLPKSRPHPDGYTFADYYEAALRVGGDYFDYISLPDGRIVIAIGDVAGKGMPAALLMARLYSSTRFQVLTQPDLEAAVTGLNEEISCSGLGHRFITFLAMELNPKKHTLKIVNAGHLAPLLRHADGAVSQLGRETSALPLGILPEQVYGSTVVQIAPGDVVVAYTDGVTEAMSVEKEIYGRARLETELAKFDGSVDALVETIVEQVEEFSGGHALRDDTCLLSFSRAPA